MVAGSGLTSPEGSTGSVAGFAVRSDVSLRYMRAGGGAPLQVALGLAEPSSPPAEPPLREWIPQPENPFHAKLWRSGTRDRIWIDGLGWYGVDHETGRIDVPPEVDPVSREERLWGIPTSLCVIAAGDQTLHAASIEIDGRAVVIGAPGRHGKTTLAAAFHAAGDRLLSEDTTRCRVGERPEVLPGPAMLRLRRDSFERLGVTDAAIVGEDADRIHLALDPGRRGDGTALPIAGLVLLRSADDLRLERIDAQAAIQELWALAFKLPTDQDRARCFGAVVELAARLPLWNLYRPLSYEALPNVLTTIRRSVAAT